MSLFVQGRTQEAERESYAFRNGKMLGSYLHFETLLHCSIVSGDLYQLNCFLTYATICVTGKCKTGKTGKYRQVFLFKSGAGDATAPARLNPGVSGSSFRLIHGDWCLLRRIGSK